MITFFQIYKGPDLSFRLESLQPASRYNMRVCAIRVFRDGSGELAGSFSTSTGFNTLSPEESLSKESKAQADLSLNGESTFGRSISDQQWALIILLLFAVFCGGFAMVLQYYLSDGTS